MNLRESVALSAWQARMKTTDGWDVFCRLDAFEEHMAVADAAILAMLNHLAANVSHKQIAEGWGVLKREGLPRLGPGPGLIEAFRAILEQARKEYEETVK